LEIKKVDSKPEEKKSGGENNKVETLTEEMFEHDY